jgi:hypothetical protein
MSWTTELANAEAAEQSYRTAAKGSFLNNYYRLDGRGAVLLGDWIAARAAASSVKVPANDSRFWGNVAARAVTAMGGSWSVVQSQPLAALFGPIWSNSEMNTHQPFGFVQLDGLFGGLVDAWSGAVWTASGRTLPCFDFPKQEVWSYLLGAVLQSAGAV